MTVHFTVTTMVQFGDVIDITPLQVVLVSANNINYIQLKGLQFLSVIQQQ